MCVCVTQRERERERVCVCVSVCVSVCLCLPERSCVINRALHRTACRLVPFGLLLASVANGLWRDGRGEREGGREREEERGGETGREGEREGEKERLQDDKLMASDSVYYIKKTIFFLREALIG